MPRKPRKDPPPANRPRLEAVPGWLHHAAFADEEVKRYLWAASRCGLEVSHWARNTLNAAAKAILEIEEDR